MKNSGVANPAITDNHGRKPRIFKIEMPISSKIRMVNDGRYKRPDKDTKKPDLKSLSIVFPSAAANRLCRAKITVKEE